MTDTGKTLTTSEYAKINGVSVSTVTHMLRQGKLCGEKRSGKWAIFSNGHQNTAAATDKATEASAKASDSTIDRTASTKAASGNLYDVGTFAQMTYLTEKGVRLWFRIGRLSGRVDKNGIVLLDAANFDRPELRHLIRE